MGGGGTAERVDSQGEVLLRGWTQSEGGTAERVDSQGEVLLRGWTVRGRYC